MSTIGILLNHCAMEGGSNYSVDIYASVFVTSLCIEFTVETHRKRHRDETWPGTVFETSVERVSRVCHVCVALPALLLNVSLALE